jgi:hypothetical protein
VLGGVDSDGVFDFELFLSSYLPFWFDLPLFVPFVGFAVFSSSR